MHIKFSIPRHLTSRENSYKTRIYFEARRGTKNIMAISYFPVKNYPIIKKLHLNMYARKIINIL